MRTEFTVTVTTVIDGETQRFERTLPLTVEDARRLVGSEVTMVLDHYYKMLCLANLLDNGTTFIDDLD